VALGAGSVAALTTVVSVSFGGYGAGLVGQKVRFAAFIIMRTKDTIMLFFILIPCYFHIRWYCDLFLKVAKRIGGVEELTTVISEYNCFSILIIVL
jgi:hypothetical protein